MENQEFDILLNKYIEGSISSTELDILKSSEEFNSYQKILDYSTEFKAPTIDVDASFKNFLAKTENEEKNEVPVFTLKRSYIVSGIAAALLLFFGLFQFLNFNKTYETGFGEQLAVMLPDSSEVVLNASSSVSFSEKKWNETRTINLKGEAFFKVKKGSKFTVTTNEGNVSVLGTQFNVNEYKNFLEVQCFEGKVLVERNNKKHILTRGKAVRQINEDEFEEWNFVESNPSWKNFESTFNNTPLVFIIENMKKMYGVEVVSENINLEKRFSGSISNTDIKIALETISNSMNLNYSIEKNKVILRNK